MFVKNTYSGQLQEVVFTAVEEVMKFLRLMEIQYLSSLQLCSLMEYTSPMMEQAKEK